MVLVLDFYAYGSPWFVHPWSRPWCHYNLFSPGPGTSAPQPHLLAQRLHCRLHTGCCLLHTGLQVSRSAATSISTCQSLVLFLDELLLVCRGELAILLGLILLMELLVGRISFKRCSLTHPPSSTSYTLIHHSSLIISHTHSPTAPSSTSDKITHPHSSSICTLNRNPQTGFSGPALTTALPSPHHVGGLLFLGQDSLARGAVWFCLKCGDVILRI